MQLGCQLRLSIDVICGRILPWFMDYHVTCLKHPLLYWHHCGFVSGRISCTCWSKSSSGSAVLALPLILLLGPHQKILLSVEQLIFSSEARIFRVPKGRGLVREAGDVNSILRACEEQRYQRNPGEMITLEGLWYWCLICAPSCPLWIQTPDGVGKFVFIPEGTEFPEWLGLSWLYFVFLWKEENLTNLQTVPWRLLCSPWQNRQGLSLTLFEDSRAMWIYENWHISKTWPYSHLRGQANCLPPTQDQKCRNSPQCHSERFSQPPNIPLSWHEAFSEGWASLTPLSKILHWKLPPKQGSGNEL